jgi:hypothetical protein
LASRQKASRFALSHPSLFPSLAVVLEGNFSLYCPLRSWIWEIILVNNKIAHDDFVSSVEAD